MHAEGHVTEMGDTGREHPSNPSEKSNISETGGAESGALDGEIDRLDTDLAAVIKAWPTLPASVRSSIMALVGAAGQRVEITHPAPPSYTVSVPKSDQ